MKKIRIVTAIVERDGMYLITQRRPSAVMPLLWEFPGGRVEEGEPDVEALKRELRERLGAEFVVGRQVGEKHHVYDHTEVVLVVFSARLVPNQTLTCQRVNAFDWVLPQDLTHYEFPDADQQLKAFLVAEQTQAA